MPPDVDNFPDRTGEPQGKQRLKPFKLAGGGGLYLAVMPNGSKYWRLKYRFAGKEKRLALGVYPEVSLRKAVARRDEAPALLHDGTDPGMERQVEKVRSRIAAEDTFEAVARAWLEMQRKKLAPSHTRRLSGRSRRSPSHGSANCQ